jgi:hypothetical protein
LLPRLQTHAEISFRHIPCAARREDAIQEMLALAWKWLLSLAEKGKDVTEFTMVFVYLVARAVKSGRRLCGQEKAKDVLSRMAQAKYGFEVEPLPSATATRHEARYADVKGQRRQDVFEEHLQDNMVTPIPDQVQFRIDFPAWLATLTARERRLIREMAGNERTKELSRTFEVSPGRISQMRREFAWSWQTFCGDVPCDGSGDYCGGRE